MRLTYCQLYIVTLLFCAQQAYSQQSARPRLAALDDHISEVRLDRGYVTVGGATIEDAVTLARTFVAFPICLELIDYDPKRDAMTVHDAIERLRKLQITHPLSGAETALLQSYETLQSEGASSRIVGYKKTTFTLIRHDISVRNYLNEIVSLDTKYRWMNYGTTERPLIVVEPRTESALSWNVSGLCDREPMIAEDLFGTNGEVTRQFKAHSIIRVAMGSRELLAGVLVKSNFCDGVVTARDLLNRISDAAPKTLSWSLSGIKGLRWLEFQLASDTNGY